MPDRITPYTAGGDVTDRIDEILLLNGEVHLEMMDEDTACLWVGTKMFTIYTNRGDLIVALRDGG